MIEEVLFLVALYGFGVYFGLLFKRRLPIALIGISGFLWGALFWVIGGMVLLMASIPYSPLSMLSVMILLGVGFGILHTRNKTWHISRQDLTSLVLIASGFLAIILLANFFNFSYVSSDSIDQLITGRRIAHEGFSSGVIEELSLRGVYLSQLQSASVFLGVDYLAAAQPAFAFSFLLAFFYLTRRIAGYLLENNRLALALSLLASLAAFSTYFIVFQFFYIHNSLISAAYLFVAVSAIWLAAREDNPSWLAMAVLALLGFSLARTEAPLFALLFLLLTISADRIPYQPRVRAILPYLLFLTLWYSYLLVRMGVGTKILDPEKTLAIIGTLVACGMLVLLSERKWVKRFLLPHLPRIMLGVLLALLVLMVVLKTDHMKGSFTVIILNALRYGRWGLTWLVFSLLLIVSFLGPRLIWEELFMYGILSYFCTLLALSFFRLPYRIGWYDSANRMLTHILPIITLYILMKAARGVSGSNAFTEKANPIMSSDHSIDR